MRNQIVRQYFAGTALRAFACTPSMIGSQESLDPLLKTHPAQGDMPALAAAVEKEGAITAAGAGAGVASVPGSGVAWMTGAAAGAAGIGVGVGGTA